MDKTQKIEEALSIIWEEREKKLCGRDSVRGKISERLNEDLLDELVKDGYVTIDKDAAKFTQGGEAIAKDIIRRQRLAERLLTDVLEIDRGAIDSPACEFEHILSKEVEESICTLLGHPKECPHGLAIPPGGCCEKARAQIESIIVPLTKILPGEAAKIVYVLTREHPQLHKLMSLGLVPGANVSVHQTSPSFVIQVEETQVALERDIAKEIYVKRLR